MINDRLSTERKSDYVVYRRIVDIDRELRLG